VASPPQPPRLLLTPRELGEQVDAASRARDAAKDAYAGGAVGLMEALEQDRQLLGARDKLAQADTGSSCALVATFRALGGGWQVGPATAARAW
jgi:outer membrane protein TolC